MRASCGCGAASCWHAAQDHASTVVLPGQRSGRPPAVFFEPLGSDRHSTEEPAHPPAFCGRGAPGCRPAAQPFASDAAHAETRAGHPLAVCSEPPGSDRHSTEEPACFAKSPQPRVGHRVAVDEPLGSDHPSTEPTRPVRPALQAAVAARGVQAERHSCRRHERARRGHEDPNVPPRNGLEPSQRHWFLARCLRVGN